MKFKTFMAAAALTVCATFGFTTVASAANTLTWPSRASYKDWDPGATYSEETYILGNVYETLTFYQDGEILPRLATSWEKSDDGATWTVQLRQGVKFHDGADFDAAAVKKSIMYIKDGGRGAFFLWLGLLDIEIPSSHTAVFKFAYPVALDLVASGQYGSYMMSPGSIDNGHEWMQQKEGQGFGTGPYKLISVDPGVQVVLEKFDDYWGGWEDGQIDRVIVKTVTEGSTRIQMMKSGEADLAVIPAEQVSSVDAADGVSVSQGGSWRNGMYLFNFKKYPTDNAKFRQALTHLWNYEIVLNELMHGIGSAPVGPLPKSMWGHGTYDMPNYDIAMAQKLLAESGVPREDWKVTVYYLNSVDYFTDSIELFQATAAEAGVTVELFPGEWGVIWDKAKNLESAANMLSIVWWPAYATPADWLYAQFRTEEAALFNLSHYANPEFDAALDAAMGTEGVDQAEAAKLYIAAHCCPVN